MRRTRITSKRIVAGNLLKSLFSLFGNSPPTFKTTFYQTAEIICATVNILNPFFFKSLGVFPSRGPLELRKAEFPDNLDSIFIAIRKKKKNRKI